MPELIAPTARLHSSWLAARDEWPPAAHQDGTGPRLAPDAAALDSPGVFSERVALRVTPDAEVMPEPMAPGVRPAP